MKNIHYPLSVYSCTGSFIMIYFYSFVWAVMHKGCINLSSSLTGWIINWDRLLHEDQHDRNVVFNTSISRKWNIVLDILSVTNLSWPSCDCSVFRTDLKGLRGGWGNRRWCAEWASFIHTQQQLLPQINYHHLQFQYLKIYTFWSKCSFNQMLTF